MDEDDEKKFLNNFSAITNYANAAHDDSIIFNFLKKSPDVLMLIRLTLDQKNQDLISYCIQPEMNEYWLEIWRYLGKYPTFPASQQNSSLIYRYLNPQERISGYQLVCGMTLYNMTYGKPIEQHLETLHRAAQYHNFAALQSLTSLYGIQLERKKWVDEERCLAPLLRSAEIHGAPAYVLCAQICINYSQYYQSSSTLEEYLHYQMQALTYLYAAQSLKYYCEAEIHNAYYGKDIFKQLLDNNFFKINVKDELIHAETAARGEILANKWIENGNILIQTHRFH